MPIKIRVEDCLEELARPKKESPKNPPFILRYEVGGEKYIKILKWEDYQHPHNTEDRENRLNYPEPPADAKGPEPGSGKPPKAEKSVNPIDLELANLLSGEMKKNNPMYSEKAEQIASWADDIRLMRERDKRSPEDIRRVILWSQADSFWKVNILSGANLRKHFIQLWGKMNQKKPGEKSKEELDREDEEALKDPGR